MACATPAQKVGPTLAQETFPNPTQVGSIQLELPAVFDAWQTPIQEAILETEQAWFAKNRWSRSNSSSDPIRLRVLRDPNAAAQLLQDLGHSFDPSVARTLIQERLAILPLPRFEAGLVHRSRPPATWLHTLRHEVVHLLALDVAALRTAPLWFQEGLAESYAASLPGVLVMPAWIPPLLVQGSLGESLTIRAAQLDPESRLQVWRLRAELCLHAPGTQPWQANKDWTVGEFLTALGSKLQSIPPLLGREFDPATGAEGMLLAAYPGRSVRLQLEGAWDGRPQCWEYQLGRTGRPEASLLVFGAAQDVVRIRLGRRGGSSVLLGRGRVPEGGPLLGEKSGAPLGRRIALHLEALEGGVHVQVGERSQFVTLAALSGGVWRIELQLSDGLLLLYP